MHPRKPKSPLLERLLRNIATAMKAQEMNVPSGEAAEHFSNERRKFLINAGKLAAGGAIINSLQSCSKVLEHITPYNLDGLTSSRSPGSSSIAPRIAIIGAGIAGLHAAFLLKQKGYNATVYEGSNRIGGRIFTANNIMGTGLYTEMGGEFIDSIHKDMLTLAKTFNLELLDTRPGNQTSLQYQAYYFNGIHYTEKQVIDAFMPYASFIKADQLGMSGIITADSFSPFDATLDNMSIAQYFDRIGLNGWLRSLLDVAYVTEYGQGIDNQTALNFLWLISPRVTNGTFEIFGASDERYKIKGGNQQITNRLAAELSGQIQLSQELNAITKNNNGSYGLTFISGTSVKTVAADYSKLMLGFTKRYWNDIGFAGYYFADTFLQSGWDNSELQVPASGGLTVYSGGQQALNVAKGTLASQVKQHITELDKMYPGAASFYNGRAERFTWPEYKWTLCSYTCFKPGQYTTIAGNEIKPVDRIYFAGEHCSYNYQGYMNGSAETGRRAAESILAAVKNYSGI